MRARSVAFAARLARFAASFALRISCCAKPAAVRFSSMVTARPCRAPLRSSFHSSSPSARSRIQGGRGAVGIGPRMTPARVSSRLAPARTSCARPRAKRRSAPVLVISMPLKRSRNSGVICSAAQMLPARQELSRV
eukprot:1803831-Pleurochrysis_carterae.AAC.1